MPAFESIIFVLNAIYMHHMTQTARYIQQATQTEVRKQNMFARMTHEGQVLYELLATGHITQEQAKDRHGITRLASAIHRLGNRGLKIASVPTPGKNTYGLSVWFSTYYYDYDPANEAAVYTVLGAEAAELLEKKGKIWRAEK